MKKNTIKPLDHVRRSYNPYLILILLSGSWGIWFRIRRLNHSPTASKYRILANNLYNFKPGFMQYKRVEKKQNNNIKYNFFKVAKDIPVS